MTRNLQRIGGKALVALMATMMLLSVFAGTAAAGTVGTVEHEVNADGLSEESEEVLGEEVPITFGTAHDGDAEEGDTLTVQIAEASTEEGDITITDASVSVDTENTDLDGAEVSQAPFDGGIYTGTVDTFVIELTDVDDGSSISGDTIDLELSFDVNPKAAEDAGAEDYTDDTIIEITEDEVDKTDPGDLEDEPIANLDITPGDPVNGGSLVGDLTTNELNFDGATETTVSAEDQFGAAVENQHTEYTDLTDLDLTNIEIDAELESQPDGVETFTDTDTTLDLDDGTESVEISIGAVKDIDTEIGDTEVVGNFELNVSSATAGVNPAADENLDIIPHEISVDSEGGDFDANDGETDLDVLLIDDAGEEGEGDQLEIAEFEVEFELGEISNEDSSILGDVHTVTAGPVTLNDSSVESSDVETFVMTEQVEDDTFETTNAAQYTLVVDALAGTVDSQSPSDNADDVEITVESGSAHDLRFDPGSGVGDDANAEYSESTDNYVDADVVIADEHNNQADNDDRYADSTTEIEFTLENEDGVVVGSATGVIDGTEGNNADHNVDIGDAEGGDADINAPLGTDHELSVEQVENSLENEDDETALNVFPAESDLEVSLASGTNEVDAGDTDELTIDLITGTDDNVDSFDVEIDLSSETLQEEDALDSDDLEVEIVDEGNIGDDESVTVTLEGETEARDFRSTAAGEFNVQGTVDLADGGEDAAQTDQLDVVPLAPTELDVEIEQTILGTIEDEGDDYDITVTIEDSLGNNADYDGDANNFDNIDVDIDVDEESIFSATIDSPSVATPSDATGEQSENVDPDSEFNEDTSTGDANIVAENTETEDDATTEGEVVHEVFELNEGFERFSLPQPAEIAEHETDHFTTWNTSASNYDQDEIELLDGTADGDAELHSGVYVSGESDDALVGFDYVTDSTVNAGEEDLEAGWNFIGTNFDVTEEDNLPLELREDLLTVDEIEDDPSTSPVILDGGLSNTLGAHSTEGDDTTGELEDVINFREGGSGEYGTYWVYVENPDEDLTSNTRQLVSPEYDASERIDSHEGE